MGGKPGMLRIREESGLSGRPLVEGKPGAFLRATGGARRCSHEQTGEDFSRQGLVLLGDLKGKVCFSRVQSFPAVMMSDDE